MNLLLLGVLQDTIIRFHNHLSKITLMRENCIITKVKQFGNFFIFDIINILEKAIIIYEKSRSTYF